MPVPVLEVPIVWPNRDESGPEGVRVGEAVIAACSRVSPTRTGASEDSLAVLPIEGGGVVLLVADGCGGMPGGDQASRAAVEAMAGSLGGAGEADPVSAILAGFDAANAAVGDLRIGAGSTLTAVLVNGDEARVFYAGDSPAIVIGQRGAIRFATLPHSATGYGVEAGLLTEAEAADHEHSGVVLNVLGFPEMFVHVGPPVALRPRDTVIVASDALTDNLSVHRISELGRSGAAEAALRAMADEASQAMLDAANGHPDDLSIVLYRPTARRGD